MLRLLLQEKIDSLTDQMVSEHFIIHYRLRNAFMDQQSTQGCIRNPVWVTNYIEALERAYAVLTSPPWRRQRINPRQKINVYVFHTPEFLQYDDNVPFMTIDLYGAPIICLPSHIHEPTVAEVFQFAKAAAIHELTHVFNQCQRPFADERSNAWEWYNEAFAVFMENYIIYGSSDYLRLLREWSDLPYKSLDSMDSYQAVMFLHYLARRLGFGFINKVWTASKPEENPFETLDRLLTLKKLRFSNAEPSISDIFASGYCMDAHFLMDPLSRCFAPGIYERYQERALSGSYELHVGNRFTTKNNLEHLACRYYKITIKNSIARIQIDLTCPNKKSAPLKVEVAEVTRDKRKGKIFKFEHQKKSDNAHSFIEISQIDREKIDYLILVITNCDVRSAKDDKNIQYSDDPLEYNLTLMAE